MKFRLRSRFDWAALNPQPLPPRYVVITKRFPKPEPDPAPWVTVGSFQRF